MSKTKRIMLVASICLKSLMQVTLLAAVFAAADDFVYKTVFWAIAYGACIAKVSERMVVEIRNSYGQEDNT